MAEHFKKIKAGRQNKYEYKGVFYSTEELASLFNISVTCLNNRINSGWSIEKIEGKAPRYYRKKNCELVIPDRCVEVIIIRNGKISSSHIFEKSNKDEAADFVKKINSEKNSEMKAYLNPYVFKWT